MSHSPPIPAGNQSPYPIQEPPHVHRPKPDAPVAAPAAPIISLGAAFAIGAGAVLAGAAAFLFVRGPAREAKPTRRRRTN